MRLFLACLLAIFLIGCSKSDRWQNVYIKTGSASFDSSKLIYPASNFCQDIQLELLNTEEQLYIYLNVYAHPVTPYKENLKEALITLDTGTKEYQLIAERLEGGQRIRVPLTSTTFVVDLMKSSNFVIIKLQDGYRTKILTTHFTDYYKKLKNLPPSFISNRPVGLAL